MSERTAIAFDFDGTLICGGQFNNDKSIHIMYSTWVACHANGMRAFLHPGRLRSDISQMTRAYIRYPGAPRFQQLAAIVNALINRQYKAIAAFADLHINESYRTCYDRVRKQYNELYSALNDAAAKQYWKPYPSAKKVLRALSRHYDLYIASGVTQEILAKDFVRHRFDRRLFKGIHGGNTKGGNDKGQILKAIKAAGYDRVLFVADQNKDWEYAREAGVEFYRIHADADYPRLLTVVRHTLPRIRNGSFHVRELRFMKNMTLQLLERYCRGEALTPTQITRWINQ